MKGISIVALAMIAALAGLVTAPARADDRQTCKSGYPRTASIEACTRLLASTKLTARERSELYANRGNAYRGEASDADHAIADFDRSIQLNAAAQVFYDRAYVYYNYKDDSGQALKDLTQAILLDPRFKDAYELRRTLYNRIGNFDRALADADQVVALAGNAASFSERAEIYMAKRDFDRALADLDQAIRLDPLFYGYYGSRGEILFEKKNFGRALEDYDQAIRLDPTGSYYYSRKAQVLLATGSRLNEALEAVEQGLRLKVHSETLDLRARVREALGDLPGALSDFKKALELAPSSEDSREGLSRVTAEIANPSQRRATASAVLKQDDPSDVSVVERKTAAGASDATTTIDPGRRVALVIGNAGYKSIGGLDNPVNDARLIARTLRELGFKLIGGDAQIDVAKPEMERLVQAFGAELQGADVGLFYYAGHGVQIRDANYLIPVDANPTRVADVDFQMLNTNLIMRQMEDAGTRLNLVVLDACRNNPFEERGWRATSRGLARMDAPEGTLISFSTQPGRVSADGADGNSPYTKALAQVIRTPGLDLFQTFNEVGLAVKAATGGAQQPWVSSSPIRGDFYFAGRSSTTARANPGLSIDEDMWRRIASSDDRGALEFFIKSFPESVRRKEAESRMAKLVADQRLRTKYSGPLIAPESDTYFAIRKPTVTREGPSLNEASRFSLAENEEVKALGSVYGLSSNDDDYAAENKIWIKVVTKGGDAGFSSLKDLLTPEQFKKRKELIEGQEKLEGYFNRAKASSGALAKFSGVYSPGNGCIELVSGRLKLNLGMAMLSRHLYWSEGNTLYHVAVINPNNLVAYKMTSEKPISFKTHGDVWGNGKSIPLYKVTPMPGQNPKIQTEFLGFLNDKMYYRKEGTSYGYYSRCGRLEQEQAKVLYDLSPQWIESSQRIKLPSDQTKKN